MRNIAPTLKSLPLLIIVCESISQFHSLQKLKLKPSGISRLRNSTAEGSYCLSVCLLVAKRTNKKQMSELNYLAQNKQIL